MGGVTPHWFSAAIMASRCLWMMRRFGNLEEVVGQVCRYFVQAACWSRKFNHGKVRRLNNG